MWYDRWTAWLLRSPLHWMLSKNTMLITVTGRKSGRPYTTPVNYAREGDTLWVISPRERTWWRNLRGGAPARLRLRGHEVAAWAEALLDEKEVAEHLGVYVRAIPLSARALGIHLENGDLEPAELAAAAREWLLVRVRLEQTTS